MRKFISLSVPLIALNALFSLFRAVPEQRYYLLFLPALETVIVVLVLRVCSRRARLASLVLAVPVTVLVLAGLGETFFRFVYRTSFSVWRDLAFAPGLFNMLLNTEIFEKAWIVIPASFAVFTVCGMALWKVMEKFSLASRGAGPAAAVLLAVLGLARVFAAPLEAPLSAAVVSAFALPRDRAEPGPAGEHVEAALLNREGVRTPGDVTFLIIESYGHTLFSRPDHYGRIKPVYDRLQRRLDESGLHAVSHFMRSPAFGGRSWLADGTILSGRRLADQAAYEDLLKTGGYTMVRYFHEMGYRTIMAAPAMTYIEDGWLSVYPFEELHIRGQFGYEGPYFGFGTLPDQYLLKELSRIRRRNADNRHVFSVAVMVSSHVPFRLVPPYIEDWNSLGDGSVYRTMEGQKFNNNWLSGGEYPEGYAAAIEYSLSAALEYAALSSGPDELFVIIGDHQPRIPISERESTYSVPVHFLSRSAELTDRLLPQGFTSGLEPDSGNPHPPMERMFSLIRSQYEHDLPSLHRLQR